MPYFWMGGDTCTSKGARFLWGGVAPWPELDHGILQANPPLFLLADQAAEERDNSAENRETENFLFLMFYNSVL